MTRTLGGSFSRRTIAATLAVALTVTTATVAPARADTKEAIAAAALLGIVAAGIIASTRQGSAHPEMPPLPPGIGPRHPLPADCRFEIRHGPDRGTWYGRRCLVANYPHWPLLPDRCEQRVYVPRRNHDVIAYDAHCLAQVGYLGYGLGGSLLHREEGNSDRGRRDRSDRR